jgi:hypothetical protein
MPENLNLQPSPADRPPDPAAAQAAAREARRRLVVSRWPLYLWMGLSALPVALLMPRWRLMFYAWLFAAYAFGLVLPAILKRLALWHGGYALQAKDAQVVGLPWKDRSKTLLLFWFPLCVSTILLGDPLLWVSLVSTYYAGLFVWSGVVLRLWELYFAAAVVTAGGVFLLTTQAAPTECFRMVAIVAAMIATPWGASFFLRWRRWVRSLPPEDGNHSVQETAHA